MTVLKSKNWEIKHHEDTDVMEFILTNDEEGKDIFWCTYEEAAQLKKLMTQLPTLNEIKA